MSLCVVDISQYDPINKEFHANLRGYHLETTNHSRFVNRRLYQILGKSLCSQLLVMILVVLDADGRVLTSSASSLRFSISSSNLNILSSSSALIISNSSERRLAYMASRSNFFFVFSQSAFPFLSVSKQLLVSFNLSLKTSNVSFQFSFGLLFVSQIVFKFFNFPFRRIVSTLQICSDLFHICFSIPHKQFLLCVWHHLTRCICVLDSFKWAISFSKFVWLCWLSLER